MKNKISFILSISLFMGMGSFAQSQYNSIYMYDYYLSYYNDYSNDKDIQQQTLVYTNKRGKSYTTKYEYGKNGKITKVYSPGKKSKPFLRDSINYDDKTSKISSFYNYTQNEKLRHSLNYKWNSDSAVVELYKTKGNGKVSYRSTWEYTDAGKIFESKRYGKGGDKLEYIWKYVYDDKDELIQTQLFKGEDKLKHVWDFNCHEEGNVLNKEKNKTQVCTWSEDRGKFLIKTYQRFDEKGKIMKYVSYYTLQDTVLVETKSFNNADELTSYTKYNSDKKITYYERFKKGKSIRKQLYEFDDNGNRNRIFYYKKTKLRGEYIYKYNDNNELLEYVYNYKDEFNSKQVYTYGDNDLISSYKRYNKKMELVGSSAYTYIMNK